MCLANALRSQGHEALLIAGRGAPAVGTLVVGDEWTTSALERLLRVIESAKLDHLALQYTPTAFSGGDWRVDLALAKFWRNVSARMPTSLIAHETYYRTWSHPASFLLGTWHKFLLQNLAAASDRAYSASELLIEEMSRWGLRRSPVRLPLGSHIDVSPADRATLRRDYGLNDCDLVLTLFGCGHNLRRMPRHFAALESKLHVSGIAHVWLLLGGVPRELLSARARVLSPGWLSSETLSAHLQGSDIFLMPHLGGVSAKRSTLMAAMAHGLPVIGTRGEMTDPFWSHVRGVALFPEKAVEDFAERVVALCRDDVLRRSMGSQNLEYFGKHLTWRTIAAKFSNTIRLQRQL